MITKKDEERYWKKVDRTTRPDGCWPFTGCPDKDGYGRFWIKGRYRRAHHVALELVGYIIPAEFLRVRHFICDNRPCVRPDHLKIGTPQDDADDKVSKDRQAHGERNGRAKLRQQDVDEVRRLYQAGGISQRALAKLFSVHHTTVRDILSGEIWAAA